MAFEKKTYREITEDILTQITKGVVREKHDFTKDRIKYGLSHSPVRDIVRVEGTSRGMHHIFEKGTDYNQGGNMIVWLKTGNSPDINTSFYVNYTYEDPTGITDVNPGSVSRTIVEAIAREIEFLYEQLNEVYDSAFIDTAGGRSLDLVVSMLGISRKPAQKAQGFVTFGRNTPPAVTSVSGETQLYDGKKFYPLKNVPVKDISKVMGTLRGISHTFEKGKDYGTDGDFIVWLSEGDSPDKNTVFYADYTCYEYIAIPPGTTVSTYSARMGSERVFETTGEGVIRKSDDGKWLADVPVSAISAGKQGNVYAGSVTVMPKPPKGVEYVVNSRDIQGGTPPESDQQLRVRAKHALEVAGKATSTSLKAAIEGVSGVRSVIIEDMPDGVSGVVRVIVSGGDEGEIREVIEQTRSAGIHVEMERPVIVDIDVSMTAVVERGFEAAAVKKKIESGIRDYISSLNIGQEVMYSKIINVSLSVPEVYDVLDVEINGKIENIPIKSTQRAEAKTVDIAARLK